MKIKDLMVKKVISVEADTPVKKVAEILSLNRIHAVPVVEGDNLVGIIAETDFFTNGSNIHLPSYIDFLGKGNFYKMESAEKNKVEELVKATARDIMTSPCLVVSPEDDLELVFDLVKKNNYHSFPVVENKKIVGIITVADMIKAINI